MDQFEIREDRIKEVRKAVLIKAIVLLLVALVAVILSHYRSNSNVHVFLLTSATILIIIILGHNKAVKFQMNLYESYILTIDSQSIKRQQYDTPDITIKTSDISRIIKNPNGSFSIRGSSPETIIEVPSQIEDYERFESILSEIKQISKKKSIQLLFKPDYLVAILALCSFAAVFVSRDKIIIGSCATIVLTVYCYSFFKDQKSQNISFQTKKRMRWMGVIFIIYFIKIVYEQLSGS